MKKYIKPNTGCNEVGGCMLMFTTSDNLGTALTTGKPGDPIEAGSNTF